ncbi:MAG: undecaprenyl/decaprenyl-phosphate alpha-N-acetylglucosaminyl 1-phosphate transferase [Candidatus Pacebacteria bacterium]|nr:undecaprenyl/decaprenyl-phosphate alpha-N-acetylglucosaminyl 1-phosphate transferase [Candidatus Paceibacterota bacterium]
MSNLFLYLKPFLIALIFSAVFTKILILLGKKYIDTKKSDLGYQRSDFLAHRKNITRFGGVAIIISFLLAIFLSGDLIFDSLKWGMIVSCIVILFFGIYDDLKNLSWKKQLLGQIVVVLIMIYAGLSVDYIANPFGGSEFRLDQIQYSIFPPEADQPWAGNIQYSILGSLFILFWIVGFMNVMNWMDGLDGLAGGVGLIGAITLFFLSISSLVNQPPLGIISIALAGAILGFLFFNFYHARIFMGTSGSMFLGFILAILAIFSGGKIATALLIMGFPILDAAWVIMQRIKAGEPIFKGDARHLHYKLLKEGFSQRKVVLFIYLICLSFGISAIVFQGVGKILSLMVLFVLFYAVLTAVSRGHLGRK